MLNSLFMVYLRAQYWAYSYFYSKFPLLGQKIPNNRIYFHRYADDIVLYIPTSRVIFLVSHVFALFSISLQMFELFYLFYLQSAAS